MAKIDATELVDFFRFIVTSMRHERCNIKKIGKRRDLSIEFGERAEKNKWKIPFVEHRKWRLGTYRSAWRLLKDEKIICGSQDVADSVDDLNKKLANTEIGTLSNVELISAYDVRVSFSNNVIIDFFCTFEDEDEIFHIFGDDNLYVGYSIVEGWVIRRATEA